MFRFTIRDALLGMAIVGLTVSWWLDRRSLVATIDEAHEALEITCALFCESGGQVDDGAGVLKFTDRRGNYYIVRSFSNPPIQRMRELQARNRPLP